MNRTVNILQRRSNLALRRTQRCTKIRISRPTNKNKSGDCPFPDPSPKGRGTPPVNHPILFHWWCAHLKFSAPVHKQKWVPQLLISLLACSLQLTSWQGRSVGLFFIVRPSWRTALRVSPVCLSVCPYLCLWTVGRAPNLKTKGVEKPQWVWTFRSWEE